MSVKFADGKCSSYKREMFRKQFKYSYLKNQQSFFNFLLHFRNLHQILNILKIKIKFTAQQRQILTKKDLVT